VIPCATCGADPIGTFNDGSPRYRCIHPALIPGDPIHPAYLAALRRGAGEKIVVVLDASELAEASACGKKRLDQSRRSKSKDYLGQDSIESHVMGAQGERAVAKWLNEPWKCSTRAYGGAADLRGLQIRTVPKTSSPLKVRKDDPDRRPCVLVVAHPPRFWIRGWLTAGEARKAGRVDDPGKRGRPAYFVEPELLRPMQELLHHDVARAAMGLPPFAESGEDYRVP
jgi:hypothetical protein